MNKKPKIFIASSVDGLNVAYAIQSNLMHDAEITVWSQSVFNPSNFAIESLLDILNKVDFGIFVFYPSDVQIINVLEKSIVRDNVILELGMFIGRLGKNRVFIISPKNLNVKIPSDIFGMNLLSYEDDRSDNNFDAATGPACHQIRKIINSVELLDKYKPEHTSEMLFSNNSNIYKTGKEEILSSSKTSDLEALLLEYSASGKNILAILDLIGFISVNINHGEDIGNRVLAQVYDQILIEPEVLFSRRIHGDKYLIIVKSVSALYNISKLISDYNWPSISEDLYVNASLGYTGLSNSGPMKDLVYKALLGLKNSKRNRNSDNISEGPNLKPNINREFIFIDQLFDS